MLRFLSVMTMILISLVQNSCSFASDYPQGKITITVLDEEGKPIEKAQVRIGFEQYINGQYKGIPIGGQSDSPRRCAEWLKGSDGPQSKFLSAASWLSTEGWALPG